MCWEVVGSFFSSPELKSPPFLLVPSKKRKKRMKYWVSGMQITGIEIVIMRKGFSYQEWTYEKISHIFSVFLN